MAHYSFLDENNIVVDVIVGKDENDGDVDWEEYYGTLRNMVCKRTSYNTKAGSHPNNNPFRKNYAGIGFRYDEILDAFIPPKPYDSWILNEDTCTWYPPVAEPLLTEEQKNEGYYYEWNEQEVNWSLKMK